MTLAAGKKLGPYEILAPLGAGGMGEVYRARDSKLEREVAIKVLPDRVAADPEALARFEREAKTIAALSHPNLVAIHDFGKHEATAYAVMELLEGETLRQRLAGDALPVRKAIEYAVQIASGLAAAHEKQIVHRDLKPENVFVTSDGRVKVLDFGLAAHRMPTSAEDTSSPTESRHTDPGIVLGTVGYMSPEQVKGLRVDHRTDIFSLGAVLYEMLTGRRAFKRETSVETMTAILKDDVPELSGSGRTIPLSLERLVRRCLEKKPEERFQSARDLAMALEAFSGGETSQVLPVLDVPSRPRLGRWLLAAGLAAAALGIGFWVGRRTAPAAVSASEPPRYRRLTFGRGNITHARFAPDGQTVVYDASWDSDPYRVFSVRLQSPRAVAPPVQEALLVGMSRSGDLAVLLKPRWTSFFVANGTLARVPLAGGAPRDVLEDASVADWSPDSQLAVIRTVKGRARLEHPLDKVLHETPGWLSSPRFSPKGDAIVFGEHPLHGDDRGWPVLVDLKTGQKRNLSSELGSLSGLAWTPDGGDVCLGNGSVLRCVRVKDGAMRRVVSGPSSMVLHDIAPDGGMLVSAYTLQGTMLAGSTRGREVDLSGVGLSFPVDIAPKSGRLLYETVDYGIHMTGLDRNSPIHLGNGIATGVSPDEKLVLAIKQTAPTQLVLVPTGAGETRVLPRGRIANFTWAAWLPDGRRIVFSGSEEGHGSRLYVQEISGSEAQPISEDGVRLLMNLSRAVAPDGRSVIALGPDQQVRLYPIAEGDPSQIPGLDAELQPVGWAEDGKSVFARPTGATRICPIYRVDVATGRRQLWREVGPADKTASPAVYALVVSPDGRGYAYVHATLPSALFVISGALSNGAPASPTPRP